MRNVITINPALHQRFRALVVTLQPRTTLGEAAEEAVEKWIREKGGKCQKRCQRESATSR